MQRVSRGGAWLSLWLTGNTSGASCFLKLTSSFRIKEKAEAADKWEKVRKKHWNSFPLVRNSPHLLQQPFLIPHTAGCRGQVRICAHQEAWQQPPRRELSWSYQRISNLFPLVSVGFVLEREKLVLPTPSTWPCFFLVGQVGEMPSPPAMALLLLCLTSTDGGRGYLPGCQCLNRRFCPTPSKVFYASSCIL